MATKCKHLRHNCPTCKRHYTSPELAETCPECGGDMRCGNYPAFGSEYCVQHGGPAPSRGWYGAGKAIVTGEHSRFQISRLAAKYIELKEDGRFLSNRHSMEIIRKRVQQLAERIDLNEAPDRLKAIMELWKEYRSKGGGSGDGPDAIKVRFALEATFEAAFHDYAAWQQMFEALELDRKMVESEVKIAKDLKAILTAEDAYELAAKLLGSIIEAVGTLIVDDSLRGRLLKRIQYEFAKLIGDRSSREVDPGLGGSGGEIIDSVASTVD